MDISAVVTFHREGALAHATMRSIARCLVSALDAGAKCEVVVQVDRPCPLTKATVDAFGWPCPVTVSHVDVGDAAVSRNMGARRATGRNLAFFDGDDYYGKDWLRLALRESLRMPGCVLHTEFVGLFGDENAFYRQLDMGEKAFDPAMLLTWNPWTSWTFAERELHLGMPFMPTGSPASGYGYEDWHWNCETLAAGVRHVLVPGTCGFYRKRSRGRFGSETAAASIFDRTRLFDPNEGTCAR